MTDTDFDVIVVGGGPAGATAATELAARGRRVALIDREGRIKPCGGAIPTRAIGDFEIAASQIVAKANAARIISPKGRQVAMEIGEIGYVGMVDREKFDPWLRSRAAEAGAERITGVFKSLARRREGGVSIEVAAEGERRTLTAAALIGADGANSAVRRAIFGPKKRPPYVFAYHEVIRAPDMAPGTGSEAYTPDRCDVVYRGEVSPDFYGWVFPHGDQVSVGCGSAVKGHDLKEATRKLRVAAGLADAETIREEGAPLPLKPMRRWDDGRSVVLCGDAAGVVAPSSGEGIYYAMLSGRLCAEAAEALLATGRAASLRTARKRFMKEHGRIFMVLGMMQYFWYGSDRRREKFVKMCADPDIQRLTWESYLNKRLVRREPLAHLRVMAKDLRELFSPRAA